MPGIKRPGRETDQEKRSTSKVKGKRDISPNIYVLKFCKGPDVPSHAANKLDIRYGNMWVH